MQKICPSRRRESFFATPAGPASPWLSPAGLCSSLGGQQSKAWAGETSLDAASTARLEIRGSAQSICHDALLLSARSCPPPNDSAVSHAPPRCPHAKMNGECRPMIRETSPLVQPSSFPLFPFPSCTRMRTTAPSPSGSWRLSCPHMPFQFV